MKQYLELLRDVLENGTYTEDRTGVGTYSVFGRQVRYDLRQGFPAVTTKKLAFKSVVAELLWFIRGETNVQSLRRMGCTIWDEWARSDGSLGPIYGVQWRGDNAAAQRDVWNNSSWQHDQLGAVLKELKENPNSRRMLVSAWNVTDISDMALPPCHFAFQFYSRDGWLDCMVYQRSADLFLGVPFNVASYALLTHLVALECDLKPREVIHTLGDAHIYSNHLEQVREQLGRSTYPKPYLKIHRKRERLEDYEPGDFELIDYAHHGKLEAPVAV